MESVVVIRSVSNDNALSGSVAQTAMNTSVEVAVSVISTLPRVSRDELGLDWMSESGSVAAAQAHLYRLSGFCVKQRTMSLV